MAWKIVTEITEWGSCPKCGKAFSSDDWFWSGGCNENGTDFFVVKIICDCGWDLEHSGWGVCPEDDEDKKEAAKEVLDTNIT